MTENKQERIVVEQTSLWEKLKDSMRVNIFQITLAGILVGIGAMADTYFRAGHFVFITTAIYIIIGLLLPLWLGISAAFIIDTLQLLFRGLLGYWYWSLQLEPAVIVFISFSLRFLFTSIKSKKAMQLVALLFMISIIVGGTIVMTMESEYLSTSKMVVKHGRGKAATMGLETDSEFWTRIVRRYVSILGMVLVASFIAWEIYKMTQGKSHNRRMASIIVVIATAMVIDWVYHPWAVYNWRIHSLGMEPSIEIFRTSVVSGIWASAFHIGIGIPLVSGMYFVAENSSANARENKY